MKHNSIETSPNLYARLGGVFYLLIIVFGILGQLFIRGSLVVSGDALATADHLESSQALWRIGAAGDVLMHVLDIPLMIILYTLLKPVSKGLAQTALVFNIAQTAVAATNKLTMLLALALMGSPPLVATFEPSQVAALVYFLTEAHDYGFGLALVFFGFACLFYGYLIYHSGYFPKILGVLIALAGAAYLINSVTLILAPAFSGIVMPVLGICFIAELSFALWLIIKGVNLPQWKRSALGRD